MSPAPETRLSRRRCTLALVLGPWAVSTVRAVPPASSEAQVKAAYLHKFPGFVEWPAGMFPAPAAPLVIGIVGADKVHQELLQIVPGRLVNNRAVEVRRVVPGAAALPLHVLHIGPEVPREVCAQLAASYRERHALVVTDAGWGLEAGSVLNFVTREGRVRFEASLQAAERAGLKLSARLLGVADRVVES